MGDEEKVSCPKCGGLISTTDTFCKFCGTDLSSFKFASSESEAPAVVEPPYERRFGFFGRMYRLIFSPSEAMMDVALAPDYGGVFVILIAAMVVTGAAVAIAIQKIQLTGPYVAQVGAQLTTVLSIAIVLAFGIFIVRWLVKSWLVQVSSNSGSNWSYTTTAVVTGYAYFADFVVGFVGLFVIWFAIPPVVLDTSSYQTSLQNVTTWQAGVTWLRLGYTLPMTLVGLLWKSYLGGLGTHHGTKRLASIGKGFVVFLVLGLIGVLLSFVT